MSSKLLCLVGVAGLLSAQNPPKDENTIFRVGTKLVLVPTSVTDRKGNFVNGLTPYDFEVFDNGKPQRMSEDFASHPISLVIAIQANANVEKILPQVQRLGNLIEAQLLGESGEVAVIMFDHRIQRLLPFTSEPDKLGLALKKLKSGSSTAVVNDAVMEAINMLKTRDSSRHRVIMVIAENKNGGSELNTRDVLSAADFANVTIYPVDMSKIIAGLTATPQPNRPNAIPPEARPITAGVIQTSTTDSQMNMGNWVPLVKDVFDVAKSVFVPNPLTVYARYTGGHQYSFVKDRDLDKAVSQIGATLHSEYMLSYSPTNQDEAGFHQIVIHVKHADLNITHRDGYYLAGKPQ